MFKKPINRKIKFQESRNRNETLGTKNRRLSKINLRTQRLKTRDYEKVLKSLIYYLLVICFLYFLFFLAFLSSLFQANEIVFLNETRIEQEKITNVIEPFLEDNETDFFPRNHFLFLKTGEIEDSILESYPSVEDVRVSRELFGKLNVEIIEKEMVIVLCGQEICSALDEQGLVVNVFNRSDLYKFSEVAEIVNDESNTLLEEGKGVNTKDFVDFVTLVRNVIKEHSGVELGVLYVPLPSAPEIKATTSESWMIYFSSEYDLKVQAEALKIILEKEISIDDRVCIEYIDLRNENRVHYKFYDECEAIKNGEIEPGETVNEESEEEDGEAEETGVETEDSIDERDLDFERL